MMENLPIDRLDEDAILARRIVEAGPGLASEAEAELYRRLAPRVRLYGLRHLRDEQAAADLVQQVLLMTIEKLRAGGLRETERVVSFVFGACRMVVLDLRRGHARRERLLQQFGGDISIADASAVPRLDRERLAQCLDRLSERERAVLVMTFYEDKQAGEVAEALGLAAGNVRVIRHRGLERLRDCVIGRQA
ncbi:MAG: sigma-70 family RNA polymerase sigma factor [Betaproteobacteria bacterium]|nr:sigma-70 family RNA polymerase sigma factor [Betaproteobacteria bacterium]